MTPFAIANSQYNKAFKEAVNAPIDLPRVQCNIYIPPDMKAEILEYVRHKRNEYDTIYIDKIKSERASKFMAENQPPHAKNYQ